MLPAAIKDRALGRRAGLAGGLVVLVLLPYYVDTFWLQLGLFTAAAAVAALGLNLLLGVGGQLSLGHAFFAAVGAFGYTALAAESTEGSAGLGLPPVAAAVLAVLLAGVLGALFTPIASRVRGLFLGVASIALVFLGLHLIRNLEDVTGGSVGRDVPEFAIGNFVFDNEPLDVLGVVFGREEKLWYLALAVLVVAFILARNFVRSSSGRALMAVRDNETMATAMGVRVTIYKAKVLVLSSIYAAAGGVLLALAYQYLTPYPFGLNASIDYLAIIVIGGLARLGGTLIGALIVAGMPLLLERYSQFLPFVGSASESSGITGGEFARYIYGALIVTMIVANLPRDRKVKPPAPGSERPTADNDRPALDGEAHARAT